MSDSRELFFAYCNQCKVLVCRPCTQSDDYCKRHTFSSTALVTERQKQETEEDERIIIHGIEATNSKLHELFDFRKKNEVESSQLHDDITTHITHLHEVINDAGFELHSEVDFFTRQTGKLLKSRRQQLKRYVPSTKYCMNRLQWLHHRQMTARQLPVVHTYTILYKDRCIQTSTLNVIN